ncbi:MAG: glycosyltransferase family 39 protein [Chloroflexota bacterium]
MSDRAVAAVLAALVLVMRVPFAAQTLWAWDSVLYARSLEQGFQVGVELVDQRPHPPGYIFYVGAAALVRLFTRDSNAALVIVGVIASALTAAAVYLVCRRYVDRVLAVMFALGAASAPLVWTYGEVAMPYALLGLLVIVLAVAMRDAITRAWPAALAASAGLGLAAGFRQDVLLLLGPLWLWMLAARSWRERGLCVAALGVAALAWFGPSASLSGGPAAYLASLGGQAARVSELSPAAGGDALLRNTLLTVYALWWGLLGFALVLVAGVIARLRALRRASEETVFFALWLLPAALIYVTIHIGDPGYLMSVLPALYVACAALIAPVAARAPRAVLAFTALLVALNIAVFVAADAPFSARAIVRHDRSLDFRVAFVRGSLPPSSTVILAQSEYLTARYYLPEYRVLFYGAEPEVLSRAAREVRVIPPTTVAVFGALSASLPSTLRLSDGEVRSGSLDSGASLVAYDLEPR